MISGNNNDDDDDNNNNNNNNTQQMKTVRHDPKNNPDTIIRNYVKGKRKKLRTFSYINTLQ